MTITRNISRKIFAKYDYVDEEGRLIFQCLRYDPKSFSYRRPDGHGGWISNLRGVRRVLYRLPEVLSAVRAGNTIFVVEGEKDVDKLIDLGVTATCNPSGATKWKADYSDCLVGANVVVIPDCDEAGRAHAEQVAESIVARGGQAQIVDLGLQDGLDISDWLASDGSPEKLMQMVAETPTVNVVCQQFVEAATRQQGDQEQEIPEGTRNVRLAEWAGKLRALGLETEEFGPSLLAINERQCNPALPVEEVVRIAGSVGSYEPGKWDPRSRNGQDTDAVLAADFRGLVDLVEDDDGQVAFLIHQGGTSDVIPNVYEDGSLLAPPPDVGWLLPRARQILAAVSDDDDQSLWRDLTSRLSRVSSLPDQRIWEVLLVPWVIHTYFLDRADYSPQILFFAEPERGKTRTGKALIYCARRGLHIETLRDPHLLRFAGDWQATLFIDVKDLWKKAERERSEDLMLQRFEKGATVPRILWPERGPFKDTRRYRVFGPTILASNSAIDHILGTRCITITMPEAGGTFADNVRENEFLEYRERLLAMRIRHLDRLWPTVEKPVSGRLGDILQPLRQIIHAIRPQLEGEFLEFCNSTDQSRRDRKSVGFSADVLRALRELIRSEQAAGVEGVRNGWSTTTSTIADEINRDQEPRWHVGPKKVGHEMSALGFEPQRTRKARGWIFTEDDLEQLEYKHGLRQDPSRESSASLSREVDNAGDVCDANDGPEGQARPLRAGDSCPDCDDRLVRRTSYRGSFLGCSRYPSCRFLLDGAAGEEGTLKSALLACEPINSD